MRKLALRSAAVGLLLILLLAGYQYVPLLDSPNNPLHPELDDFPLPPSAHLVRWDGEGKESDHVYGTLSFAALASEAELVKFYHRELEKRYWEKGGIWPGTEKNLTFTFFITGSSSGGTAQVAEFEFVSLPIGPTRVKVSISTIHFSGPEE